MKIIDVKNWEEFEERIRDLNNERLENKSKQVTSISHFLYRGHADSQWRLETTLDRYAGSDFSVKKYYKSTCRVRAEIETFSGNRWQIPTPVEFEAWLDQKGNFYYEFPAYEYMVYLRHHGFPSPLLDWSRSPYVAAFFAFNNFSEKSEKVSIYVYQEYTKGGKVWSSGEPHIHSRGPFVTSHQRHFLQKSEYTVCLVNQGDEWVYTDHEKTFSKNMVNQDILYKFNIPSTERVKVLQKLDEYNLNSFSLFNSEESLMATMASREFHLEKNNL